MAFYDSVRGWFGRWGALGERVGQQHPVPSTALVSDTANVGPDGALQISAVWACIERRAFGIEYGRSYNCRGSVCKRYRAT